MDCDLIALVFSIARREGILVFGFLNGYEVVSSEVGKIFQYLENRHT